jgi:hypothetical protein
VLGHAPASAQEASVALASALTLEAPAACPDTAELQVELASLVGRPVSDIPLPRGLDPHLVVLFEAGRFVLHVGDEEGGRTLADGSCSALVRAAALIIALHIDADAATLAAATAAEPEPRPPGPHAGNFDAFEWSGRLANPYPRATLPGFAIGAGGLVEGGIVPVASASVALDIVVRADRFETRVRGSYVFEQPQPRAYGVAASAMLATLLGCGRPFEADFAIAFCGGVEVGSLFAHSYGVAVPALNNAWTTAVVVGVWLPLFPWRGLDVSLGAEVWWRFYRPNFEIAGLGPVWDSDPFGGRFGLLVHFDP